MTNISKNYHTTKVEYSSITKSEGLDAFYL